MHRVLVVALAVLSLFVAGLAHAQVRVKGYYRKNGTYVAPHYRSNPDGNFSNNWSTRGNVNPYTGAPGYRASPAGTGISGAGAASGYRAVPSPLHHSPSDGQLDTNLRTCRDGRYPALCNHALLTHQQQLEVRDAELRENLRKCSDGRYPALCNHALLTREQQTVVLAAERRENLRKCLDGRYPVLCKHDLPTAQQQGEVRAAERRENFRRCDGRYPALCNHALLDEVQVTAVREAERKSAASRSRPAIYPTDGADSLPEPEVGSDDSDVTQGCCKVCRAGCACGNTCISCDKT